MLREANEAANFSAANGRWQKEQYSMPVRRLRMAFEIWQAPGVQSHWS